MLSTGNIQVYTELLTPPDGYVTEQALGLTYSLDLTMVLAASVSLFMGKELDGTAEYERYDVLASLQDVKKKMRIFCQSGQIKVPPHYNKLYQLIEPSITMIPMEEGSFHPKLWLLRFREKASETILYRLIVLSKNLTDSRDWDITYFADGEITQKNNQNTNLITFLSKPPLGHDDFLNPILKELKNVSFEKPYGTDTFDFYGYLQKALPFSKSCSRSLIISPFVRTEQLKNIPIGQDSAFLISRQEELDKISTGNLKPYDCYVLKDTVIDGETIIDEELVHRKQNNIHAKIYVWENDDQREQTNVFLGSANCSNAAFSQNVEAMIHLKYLHSIWEDILYPLVGNEDDNITTLCSPYIPREAEEEDPELESVRKIKRSITLVMDTVIINRSNSSYYKMTIPINDDLSMKSGISVTIAPLTQKDLLLDLMGREIVFDNLSIERLTTFFIITINVGNEKSESFVMRLKPEIDEEIIKAREQLLMRQLFTSMKKLLSYIAYLLDVETFDSPEFSSSNFGGKNGASSDSLHYEILPLYEKLLVMAADNPIQLKKIDIALATLKESNELDVSEFQELITFWEPFRKFIPDIRT
ncbi:MAG: hypothetical protein DRH89_01620 [Candidatus Cloacimonadota bacterium]|nr:MAG: hypothetical protein DRH89_01620 [Candidatus Cloacimonadota bacterium]